MAVASLFRRQIVGGAENVFFVRDCEGSHFGIVFPAGQTHVEHLDHAALIDEQIGRFDIAMNQPGIMRMLQTIGCLANVVGGHIVIELANLFDERLQIASFDILHDQEVIVLAVVLIVVDVVRTNDIFVIELGGRASFKIKPFEVGGIVDTIRGQMLDGHQALHLAVLGEVDAAHSAGAQVAEQLILFADEEETFVLAVEKLVALPRSDELGGDELFGKCLSVNGGDCRRVANPRLAWRVLPAAAFPPTPCLAGLYRPDRYGEEAPEIYRH